jgi:hypothetical protein
MVPEGAQTIYFMQLKKLQHYFADYSAWLCGREADARLYYWDSQRRWQQHWDMQAPDLRAGFQAALDNARTRRLWSREGFEPKRMMLLFMEMEPEFVRSMFIDLFDEKRDLSGRADRFVFYCDQLMSQYRERFPLKKEGSHYHNDDYGMVSLYLTFQYPNRHAPYEAGRLRSLLERLGAPDLPVGGDFERHAKVMRTIYQLMQKEGALMANHRARLDPSLHYMDDSLLLAFDFACFVTGA